MNQNLTDITLVVDRSGSMSTIRDDMNGGIANFIEEQKNLPGEAKISIVQFDTEVETVVKCVNIKECPTFDLQPRGMTALLDALGRTIVQTGERLRNMPENERPGLVIIKVITDGDENSSREYNLDQIQKLVKQQQDEWKWQFIFLGANIDAFSTGRGMGVKSGDMANFTADSVSVANTYAATSAKVGRMRGLAAAGLEAVSAYTQDELVSMSVDNVTNDSDVQATS